MKNTNLYYVFKKLSSTDILDSNYMMWSLSKFNKEIKRD